MLTPVIRIRLSDAGSGYTRFRRSHAIKTPIQIGPYNPSRDINDDPGYALNLAVESLASYYRDAVRLGHSPQDEWLVPQTS